MKENDGRKLNKAAREQLRITSVKWVLADSTYCFTQVSAQERYHHQFL
jgi:hypothetical protein